MKIQLTPDNPQWNKIDYKVQSVTGKSGIKIIGMWKHNEDNYRGHQSIINLTDFSKDYQKRVVDKTIPLEDLIINCGHVNLHNYSTQRSKIFHFLICRTNLGRISHPQDDVVRANSIVIPPEKSDEALQYNFYIKQSSQYTVLYEITFTVSDEKDFKLADYQCSSCQNRIPTSYCKVQSLFFCDDCWLEHHKTKLMSTHQHNPIDKINTLGQCKNHNQKFEYFCLQCQKYLCYKCTQKGTHFENYDHPYKPIKQYYEIYQQNIQILPKKQKEKIEILLANLENKRKEVEQNYNEVKKRINLSYEIALKELQQLSNEKMYQLLSCQIELRMIHDKIQWNKALCKFQSKSLKPIYFIQSEIRFQQSIKALQISDFEIIFNIKPDIQTQGQMKVVNKDTIIRRNQTNKNQIKFIKQFNQGTLTEEQNRNNLYKFNPKAVRPKKGNLCLALESSNLHFFKSIFIITQYNLVEK